MFKTRQEKLEEKIRPIVPDEISFNLIMKSISEYEKANLNTIRKLKRKRLVETNKIKGGLKQTIDAHGPITKELIGSAVKRIYGNLIENNKNPEESWINKFLLWLRR